MIERLDEARKYVELYRTTMNNGYAKRANMYGLCATSILTEIYDTTRNREEVKEVVSLAKEVLAVFYNNADWNKINSRTA